MLSQVLHSGVSSWPYLQTLDYAGEASQDKYSSLLSYEIRRKLSGGNLTLIIGPFALKKQ
jgi:hypothetical protein